MFLLPFFKPRHVTAVLEFGNFGGLSFFSKSGNVPAVLEFGDLLRDVYFFSRSKDVTAVLELGVCCWIFTFVKVQKCNSGVGVRRCLRISVFQAP